MNEPLPKSILSTPKSSSDPIFTQLEKYEPFRFKRRGLWNIISVLIIIVFFALVEYLKQFWPKNIENPGHFYFIVVLIYHESLFILCNAVMYVIYKTRVFEKYKTFKEKWPWDEDYNKWRELLKETGIMLFINQGIILPLVMLPQYLKNECPNNLSYEELPELSTIIFHIIVFLFIEDFSFYWLHRMLHHKSLYKLIHKTHHRYRLVVGICSEYCHPLEYFLANILPTTAGPLILGQRSHLITYFAWACIRIAETTDGHSGYEFPWSPFRLLAFSAGQEYHNFHHLTFDGNYGSFLTVWDRLFKTTNKEFLKFIDDKYAKGEEVSADFVVTEKEKYS